MLGPAGVPLPPPATASLPAAGVTVTLRCGLGAVLRPLTPADRGAYLAGVEHIGAESRRRRFLAVKPSLSEGEIRYFLNVDHHDHEAIIAVVDGAVVGVARFVRDREDRGAAEFAVVVADQWQCHGAGAALLRRLVERAAEEGIARLLGSVLGENVGLFATLRRLRLRWRVVSTSAGISEIEVNVPAVAVALLD